MEKRPLTPRDLQTFERMLRIQHSVLTGDVEQLESEATVSPDAPQTEIQGEADSVERERSVDLELLESEEQTLREIVEALGRIRAGTYGRCQDCNGWISRGR